MKLWRVKLIVDERRDLAVQAESGEAAEQWVEDNLLDIIVYGGFGPIIWNEGELPPGWAP